MPAPCRHADRGHPPRRRGGVGTAPAVTGSTGFHLHNHATAVRGTVTRGGNTAACVRDNHCVHGRPPGPQTPPGTRQAWRRTAVGERYAVDEAAAPDTGAPPR